MKIRIVVWLLGLILSGGISSILGTYAQAATEVSNDAEEVPFDELVKELNSKVSRKDRIQTGIEVGDPFDRLQIHLSLGFIQTVNSLLVAERSISRLEDGVQLGLGVDIFSPEWVAEGLLKNYGRSTQNDTNVSLREFDIRLSYIQQAPQNKMKFRLANGLGARYLRYNNKWTDLSQIQTTPVYLLGFGILIPIGTHFDLDIEMQGHMALISESIDRHGLSLILRLDNVF